MTVTITLTAPGVSTFDPDERAPLSRLTSEDHIHGTLVISIDGRPLPHLGFFGPADVCVGTWARELQSIARALRHGTDARYVFDEGEQGQPAYELVRSGDRVLVSIIASEISGGSADPAWQAVPCDYPAFIAAIGEFLQRLRALLHQTCPEVADEWWRRNAVPPDAPISPEFCLQCAHPWDPHRLLGHGNPPLEGWMECPEEGCPCHMTWSANPEVRELWKPEVGSSRVDLQACKLEYSIVSPK